MSLCLKYLLTPLLLFVFFTNPRQTLAQSKKTTLFNHLTKTEGSKLTLETDLTTLLLNRKTNNYFPATLTTDDGVVRKMEIRPRGKYRRKTCEIPPLKLKFSKKSLVKEGLDTMNELRLVVPCFDNDKGDELILREYLIYKMFEKLSPVSMRARLVKVILKNTHVEASNMEFWALLVEDEEELAARLDLDPVETFGIEPDSLQINQAALTVMFNYMIGNTDWEFAMMRNVKLMRSRDSGKILTVPYDFDFSGFVSAPYSSPSAESGLKTVRERFLMSSGLKPEALKRATHIIKAHKDEFYAICRSKYLSRNAQDELVDYLESFFKQAETGIEMPSILKAPTEMD